MTNIIKFLIHVLTITFLINSQTIAQDFKITKIVELNDPWSMTFINDQELFISEQNGKLSIVNINTFEKNEIKHNLNFLNIGQGGLLDVAFKNNNIWISYTEIREEWEINGFFGTITSTSIAKSKLNRNKMNFKNIFQSEPPLESPKHFGSRLVIKDDYIYASIGERNNGMIAQDPTKHPGSIIRIHTDGSIPKDNPKFKDKPNWLPEIFQIGFRNPQGLTLSEYDQKIYISNHGPKGGDWFGELKEGENYGWKILGWGGTNYSGTKIGPKWLPGFTKPIKYWVPSIAVSAITIYKGEEFKEWNSLALITSLKDKSLRTLDFSNLKKIQENIIFKNKIGRIRDIKIHPKNGKIFFLADNKLWIMEKN